MSDRVGRITRRADFLRLARSSRRWVTPGLIVQADRAPTEQIRVGFTTTRKLGKAVVRNRIRRRLRALAREVLARHAVAGQDIVLVGRAGTATRSFAALREEFETALKRLKVWTESRGAAS